MKKTVTKFILGKKLYMTQLFDDAGTVFPVTVVSVPSNVVTQVKTKDKEGYSAVQVGYGVRRAKTVSKSVQGHTKSAGGVFAKLSEFLVAEPTVKVGDKVEVSQFVVGEKVKISGLSKGRGFQGVVKRHGFHGQPSSHGHKDQSRKSGSIGAGGVQRVFKDLRMSGRMGHNQVTVANLKVVKVDTATNELFLGGAVPGARNSVIAIYQ